MVYNYGDCQGKQEDFLTSAVLVKKYSATLTIRYSIIIEVRLYEALFFVKPLMDRFFVYLIL